MQSIRFTNDKLSSPVVGGVFTTDENGNFSFQPRGFNVSFGRIAGNFFGNSVDNSFTFVLPPSYQPLVTGQLMTDVINFSSPYNQS